MLRLVPVIILGLAVLAILAQLGEVPNLVNQGWELMDGDGRGDLSVPCIEYVVQPLDDMDALRVQAGSCGDHGAVFDYAIISVPEGK